MLFACKPGSYVFVRLGMPGGFAHPFTDKWLLYFVCYLMLAKVTLDGVNRADKDFFFI